MYFFCDFLIFGCLFFSGFHYGYFCKYTYGYNNFSNHWFTILGILLSLLLASGWCLRKYKKKRYLFENFYIIFYGVICSIISSVFLLTENTDISFYFIFMALVFTFLPTFNYISLRCATNGCRPARIALGNALYFAGLAAGFTIFDEFRPKTSGWVLLGLATFIMVCLVINEFLQQFLYQDYKSSCDLVYNLLNEEKLIYAKRKSIMNLFVGRDDYVFRRNVQWLVVGLSIIITLEKCCFFSSSYLDLMTSATRRYISHGEHLYGPFALYAAGCALGSLLMLHYKPKLLYLMFGLIKITISLAIVGVYSESFPQDCFIFLCFYYISMGVYSSVALQMLVECTPFLYTELALGIYYSIELAVMEALTFEIKNEDNWSRLWIMTIITVALTAISIVIIQLYLPESVGLIEIRNRLLGIHRQPVKAYDNKLWRNNFYLQMEIPSNAISVVLDKNRVYQQYPPPDVEKKTKF